MGARTVLMGWLAMVGVRLVELAQTPGHYMIEMDCRRSEAVRWRVYEIGAQPGRWEQPRSSVVGRRSTAQQ